MTLSSRVSDLASRVGREFKTVRAEMRAAGLPDTVIIGGTNSVQGASMWPTLLCAAKGWAERNFAVAGATFLSGFSAQLTSARDSTAFDNAKVGQVIICDASYDTRAWNVIDSAVDSLFASARSTFPNARVMCVPELWPYLPADQLVGSNYQTVLKLREHVAAAMRAGVLRGVSVAGDSWTWLLNEPTSKNTSVRETFTSAGHAIIANLIAAWMAGVDTASVTPPTLVTPGTNLAIDEGVYGGEGLRVGRYGGDVYGAGRMVANADIPVNYQIASIPASCKWCSHDRPINLLNYTTSASIPAKIAYRGSVFVTLAAIPSGTKLMVDASWRLDI